LTENVFKRTSTNSNSLTYNFNSNSNPKAHKYFWENKITSFFRHVSSRYCLNQPWSTLAKMTVNGIRTNARIYQRHTLA